MPIDFKAHNYHIITDYLPTTMVIYELVKMDYMATIISRSIVWSWIDSTSIMICRASPKKRFGLWKWEYCPLLSRQTDRVKYNPVKCLPKVMRTLKNGLLIHRVSSPTYCAKNWPLQKSKCLSKSLCLMTLKYFFVWKWR